VINEAPGKVLIFVPLPSLRYTDVFSKLILTGFVFVGFILSVKSRRVLPYTPDGVPPVNDIFVPVSEGLRAQSPNIEPPSSIEVTVTPELSASVPSPAFISLPSVSRTIFNTLTLPTVRGLSGLLTDIFAAWVILGTKQSRRVGIVMYAIVFFRFIR
jgi:hypothetical protein